MRLKSRDISVIVQGHVKGRPDDPVEERWTLQSLQSVRRHMPDAQLILSTFTNSDTNDLPYDELVLSEDPGPLDLGDLNRMVPNTNRQIISTCAGLARAERPYALKMRYDLVLGGIDFLEYFGRFNERHPDWCLLRQRVVTATSISLDARKACAAPFAPSDWFHFGLREDVRNLWQIPLIPPKSAVPGAPPLQSHRYSAEQHIWVSFLRKHDHIDFAHVNDTSHDAVALTDLTIVNNLVLLEPDQIPVCCLKYSDPNLAAYSKWFNYTHSQWLALYQRLCLSRYHEARPMGWTPFFEPWEAPYDCGAELAKLVSRVAVLGGQIDLNPAAAHLMPQARAALQRWPGSDSRCLAAVAMALEPRLVMEIGPADGLAALVLKSVLAPPCYIFSVRYGPRRHRQNDNAHWDNLDDDRCSDVTLDISLPGTREVITSRMAEADLIVINLDDGRLLEAILQEMPDTASRQHPQWVIIHQLRNWSVAPVWHRLKSPKLDLSTFSSNMGIGIARLGGVHR
jgi:WavE lipopolysaccharide synthesis